MKVEKEYLDRLRNETEDPGQVFQDFLDEVGDFEYFDSLLSLCQSGGAPDEDFDPQYAVQSFERAGSKITFTCNVYFDEKHFGGGCPDMPTIDPRAGTVAYEVDLSSGVLLAVNQE